MNQGKTHEDDRVCCATKVKALKLLVFVQLAQGQTSCQRVNTGQLTFKIVIPGYSYHLLIS